MIPVTTLGYLNSIRIRSTLGRQARLKVMISRFILTQMYADCARKDVKMGHLTTALLAIFSRSSMEAIQKIDLRTLPWCVLFLVESYSAKG